MSARAQVGILGGSGLYEIAELEAAEEVEVSTPFGTPSDRLRVGRWEGRPVAFLARHGRRHHLLPGEINYRANIHAMKQLGVERIVSVSAVGSLRETIRPRDIVVPDQFVDRTRARASTFFGEGIVAHVAFADPVCPELRRHVLAAARRTGGGVHGTGTYLCIEGPAFSTRAESQLYRQWGADIIGMTNATEAKLAREAELCYATLALVTDYDCWHAEAEAVTVEQVLENLRANAARAVAVLREALRELPPRGGGCRCGAALRDAILTPLECVPQAARQRLRLLLAPYLERAGL